MSDRADEDLSRAFADLAGARVTVPAKLTFGNQDLHIPWFERLHWAARLAFLEATDNMVIGGIPGPGKAVNRDFCCYCKR